MDLNFNAINFNSEIINRLSIITLITINPFSKINSYTNPSPFSTINGIEIKKSALAGVGKPINESLCLLSMLNFAKR